MRAGCAATTGVRPSIAPIRRVPAGSGVQVAAARPMLGGLRERIRARDDGAAERQRDERTARAPACDVSRAGRRLLAPAKDEGPHEAVRQAGHQWEDHKLGRQMSQSQVVLGGEHAERR